MPSIFLSHNKVDKAFARKVAADLQRAGGRVWLDEEKIELGDSIQESIQQAIDACDYLGVVLSPESVESKWVRQELRQALDREINANKVIVLPLLLRDCDIPGFLRDKKYADFRNPAEYISALNSIKRKLGLTLTESREQSDLAIQMVMHEVRHVLASLDSGLHRLVEKAPGLRSDIKPLSDIAGVALYTFRGQAIAQQFNQGVYQLRFSDIHLGDELERIVRNVETSSGDGSVHTELRNLGRIPRLHADRDLISVAFFSLIDNAFRYSKRNGIIVVDNKIDKNSANIEIMNQGMPAKSFVSEDIFAEGYRGVAAQTSGPGLGMGLYTAKLIIAAHGGDIVYSYLPESGMNVFTVSIPTNEA